MSALAHLLTLDDSTTCSPRPSRVTTKTIWTLTFQAKRLRPGACLKHLHVMRPAQVQPQRSFPLRTHFCSLPIRWRCLREAPRPNGVLLMELQFLRRIRYAVVPLATSTCLGVRLRLHSWTPPLIAGPSRKAPWASVTVSLLPATLGLKVHSRHQSSQSCRLFLLRRTILRQDLRRCPALAQRAMQPGVASRARSSTKAAAAMACLAPSATCAGLTRGRTGGRRNWRLGEQRGPNGQGVADDLWDHESSLDKRPQGGCKP